MSDNRLSSQHCHRVDSAAPVPANPRLSYFSVDCDLVLVTSLVHLCYGHEARNSNLTSANPRYARKEGLRQNPTMWIDNCVIHICKTVQEHSFFSVFFKESWKRPLVIKISNKNYTMGGCTTNFKAFLE